MILIVELLTAILGIRAFYTEAISCRFRNYATSIFLLCFVPLFCVYPVIARIAVGGAYSVQPGDTLVFSDNIVYLIYQMCCLGIILVFLLTSRRTVEHRNPDWKKVINSDYRELAIVIAVISLGIALYVRSTGFGVLELISASRFEWFNNASYSSATFVVSSYLMALSPVAVLLAAQQKKYAWVLLFIIAELVFFGILSKDRKWLIYILSAGFAAVYYYQGFSLTLRKRLIVIGVTAVLTLAFWQIARGVLFEYLITGKGDVVYLAQEMAIDLMTRGDLPYYYNASITAINLNINNDYSIPFGILSRQILFFLPADYSFGLKIEDISALFSDRLQAGDSLRRGNMPPGLFGLFILSFGWAGGIITCAMLPLGVRAIDRYIQRSRGIGSFIVAAHFMSATMLLLRGDDSSATYFIVFSLVAFLIIRPSSLISTNLSSPSGRQSV